MSPRFDRARILGEDLPATVRSRRALAFDLVEAALDAVEPGRCTRAALARAGATGPHTVFAFGKASVAMARAAAEVLDVVDGALVALEPATVPGLVTYLASHPDPAPDALRTGGALRSLADGLGDSDAALCLVSGGGSSMLELPREGVSLRAMSRLIQTLRERGADIAELNAVRRACSQIKGGGLARCCAPASVLSVILSDVPGHPPWTVASGPSCPPPDGAPSAPEVLARYQLTFDLPAPEPPPDFGDRAPRSVVAADVGTARAALIRAAAARGWVVIDRAGVFCGDAASLGRELATHRLGAPWVWGGETTVAVRGAGEGGRNQEVVLGALASGWQTGLLLAVGTDGVDGRSPAAGALLDEAVVQRVERLGLDPEAALNDNDSYTLFERVGASLRCGPTGTNVADLCLYLP